MEQFKKWRPQDERLGLKTWFLATAKVKDIPRPQMLKEAKPDVLIVTTMDSTHHEFIIKGLNAGIHVISEKPMTTDEFKCQDILDAERKSGKKLIVTFNYRYSPHRQKLYELLRAGEIGELTSVDFHWYLDVYHGADYFRRWHRRVINRF